MGGQPRPQFDGKGLHALPPRLGPVGEDAVVDLTEQALDQSPDDGSLVREVGIHRVRSHADLGGNTPHRCAVCSALVEQVQRGVEDLILGQRPPGAWALPLAWWCHCSRLLRLTSSWTSYSVCTSNKICTMYKRQA